jgi:transposase
LDAGYRGEDKGKDWVEKTLGWSVEFVESARKAAPEEVLMGWAREWAKEGMKVDWEKLMAPKGFQVLPRRWVVERTFSWIDQNRRMSLGTTRGYLRAAKRVGICCHDPPHDEAPCPHLRPFHTVSEGEFSEVQRVSRKR